MRTLCPMGPAVMSHLRPLVPPISSARLFIVRKDTSLCRNAENHLFANSCGREEGKSTTRALRNCEADIARVTRFLTGHRVCSTVVTSCPRRARSTSLAASAMNVHRGQRAIPRTNYDRAHTLQVQSSHKCAKRGCKCVHVHGALYACNIRRCH